MKKLNIAVLTTSELANKKLIETIEARGHTAIILDPRKLYLYISEHQQGYDRFYIQSDGDSPNRVHGNTIDFLIPRLGSSVAWGSSVLRFLTENVGIPCYNSAWSHIMAGDKSFTSQRMSSVGVPVPKTIVCESPRHVAWAVKKLGMPIVIKSTHGSQGTGVAIVDSIRSANSVFEWAYHQGMKVILSEFIETEDNSDFRAWVVNDKVICTMKRTAVEKGQFKSNISLGGRGEKWQLSEEHEKICVKAAQCLGLGVAGIDLMINKQGQPFVIEANSNPGLAIVTLINFNVFEPIIDFVEQMCGKKDNSQSMNQANAQTRADLLFNPNLLGKIDQLIKANDILKIGYTVLK